MRFEFFISRRYLASRERRGLISLITIISVGGVAVGVAALMTVIGVMDGFDKELMKRIMSTASHITIRRGYAEPIRNYDRVTEIALEDPDVLAASPLISRQAILQPKSDREANPQGAMISGFDFAREREITSFLDDVILGKREPGRGEIVIGLVMASRLGTYIGDQIMVTTTMKRFGVGRRPKTVILTVVGLFKSGLYEVDDKFAYTSLEEAQRIFLLENEVDLVHLKIKDPYKLEPVQDRLKEKLGRYGFAVIGWNELNPDFFNALALEKLAMFVILLLIVIVAAFNIIGTLVMIVIEKTRDIGILRSMGASQRQILRIFLLQGLIVGFMGIMVGMGIGTFLCWSMNTWFPIQLPAGVYGIERLPVLIRWDTVFIIIGSAWGICLLASLLPAWRASRLQPTDALRYE